MIIVSGLQMPIASTPQDGVGAALKKLGVSVSEIKQANLHKLSVDARKGRPSLVYSIAVQLKDPAKEMKYKPETNLQIVPEKPVFTLIRGKKALQGRVVVCGFGPAGLFAALELAEAGYRPLVLERGPEIEERRKAVERFEQGGELNPDANIQFGEGGAGTFSDGKLTTRIRDPFCGRITQRLLEAGAPEEIQYLAKPHVGTDRLQGVLVTLREKLLAMGGEIQFNTRVTGFVNRNGCLAALETNRGEISCGPVVLAVGHSARDTFAALSKAGAQLESKGFSVGYRIEHLQAEIDKGLYHEAAGHAALPPGEYQLSAKSGGRGIYTFCMCPGGSVVAAQSEEGAVVTNGMSLHARNGLNANAAVVAGVNPADFNHNPFEAIAFQQKLEQAAFKAGGGGYAAPGETVGSYMSSAGKLELGRVVPSYPRGLVAANLADLLPWELGKAIGDGLRMFGRKLPGYDADDAVLTGLETRTSSPVRIPRSPENLESFWTKGLYPCGEGAGYAGGIMSAAVDGVKVAKAIIEEYKPD